MSKHQAFVDYFTHEFMEELWYLQKLARGDISKRKEANPWETFFNVTQALLSLAPIPGLPLGFLLSKELISKCIEYGGKAVKLAQQASKSTQDFLNKMDQVQGVYNTLTGKPESKGLVQQEGPMDLVAIRVLVELLGRGLAERYEQVLTDYLDDPSENQVPLARVAARRIFEYLQSQPLQDPTLGSDLLAQRGRLLNGVILGKVEKSWREHLTDKIEPPVIKNMSEVNLLLKESLKKQYGWKEKLTHKNKFTAEGVLTRSAWYDAKQVYAHPKTTWRKETKPEQPKYGYAYLANPKPLPIPDLKPDTRVCVAPPHDRRYYRAMTQKDIQSYLDSSEMKDARQAKKTTTFSFHDFLRKNGHPQELQAVCHDDLTAIKDWSFSHFSGVDFSGAKITGNVSGANFTRSYLVGITAQNVQCTEDYPVDLTQGALGFADFRQAKFPKAQLTQADLSLANFSGANLTAIQSEGANWYKTDLSEVKREDLLKKQAQHVKAVQTEFERRMQQSDQRISALEKQLATTLQRLRALEEQKPKTNDEMKRLNDQIGQLRTELTATVNRDFVESCTVELKELRQRTEALQQDIKTVRHDVGGLFLRVDQFERHLTDLKTLKSQVTTILTQAGDVGRKILAEHTAVQVSHRVKSLEFYLPPTVIKKLPEKMTLDELMTALNKSQVIETKTTESAEMKEEKYPLKTQEDKAAEVALPERFDAIAIIDQFLVAEESVLLLLGEPGAGKSLSMWQAARRRLEQFKSDMSGDAISRCWLPIVIELNAFQLSELVRLIDRQLREKYGLDEKAITKLKQTTLGQTAESKVLLMLDGYDELIQTEGMNRREHSELFKRIGGEGWSAGQLKVIVTCRRRFLANDSEERMIFGVGSYQRYQRYELLPFTQEQISRYVQMRSAGDTGGGLLKPAVYLRTLQASESIRHLVSNPFVLQLFLESLPRLQQDQPEALGDLSRFALYQAFFDQWIEREVRRLSSTRKKEHLGRDSDVALVEDFRRMAIYLAMSLYAHNRLTVQLGVEGSDAPSDAVWDSVLEILGEEAQKEYKLLSTLKKSHFGVSSQPIVKQEDFMRQAQARANQLADVLPLIRSGDSYQFVHKSFYEYLVTAGIVMLSGEDQRQQTAILAFFKRRLIQTEPTVLYFLIDLMSKHRRQADQERRATLSQAWNAVVERSRDELQLGWASSNAATILNYCNVNMTYLSWAGVQLPGVDLSYSLLWGSDLSRARLTGANLRHALWREVKLTGADLTGVQMGERPWLKLDKETGSIAFHPLKPWLAVAQKREIVLINYATEIHLGVFKGHTDNVRGVAFSPDGALLASGSYDGSCRLWSVQSQEPVGKPLTEYTTGVSSVAFSPDGTLLASGSYDQSCRLWSVQSQKPVGKPLTGHTGAVYSIAFSPDGTLLASGSYDQSCRLWSVQSQKPVGKPLTGHTGAVYSIAFSSDGTLLASGSYDQSCRLWSVQSQKPVGKPLTGHTGGVSSVAFSSDGALLASGSEDKSCRLWSVQGQEPMGKSLTGHTDHVDSVAFSPNGALLASGSKDKSCRLWSVQSQEPVDKPLTGHTGWVYSVVFSPDGVLLASGSEDKSCHLWSMQSQGPVGKPLTGHKSRVRSVVFSPNGALLASGSDDDSCRLWSVQSQEPVGKPLTGHTGWVESVAFSPDGALLASGSFDESCRLWSVQSQEPVGKPMMKGRGYLYSVAFSPDGALLAFESGRGIGAYIASRDHCCLLWSVQGQELVGKPLIGHTGWVYSIAFSPDGALLASGSGDYTCRLWFVQSQEPVGKPLTGHTNSVMSIAFSPDGALLASGSYDQSCRLWSVTTQTCVATIPWVASICSSVAFQPNKISAGQWKLAIGDENGFISLWQINKQSFQLRLLDAMLNGKMPLDVTGVDFTGCRMNALTSRLLGQHGGNMKSAKIVEVKEETEKEEKKDVSVKSLPAHSKSTASSTSTMSSSASTVSGPVTAFQKKLQELCEEKNYTFLSKRPEAKSLVIQFTATDSVLATTEEIKTELISTIKLLQTQIATLGITAKQYQVKPNWKEWSLTITGETAILDKIAALLQTAGLAYFPSLTAARSALFYPAARPSSTPEYKAPTVTCAVQ